VAAATFRPSADIYRKTSLKQTFSLVKIFEIGDMIVQNGPVIIFGLGLTICAKKLVLLFHSQ